MLVVAIVGFGVGHALLARTYWIAQMPQMAGLVAPAAALMLAGGTICALAVARQWAVAMLVGLAVTVVPMAALVLRAEALAEPLFSWRPVARALADVAPE